MPRCVYDLRYGRSKYFKLGDITVMNVLVIGYCDLRFIWDLVLEIWDF